MYIPSYFFFAFYFLITCEIPALSKSVKFIKMKSGFEKLLFIEWILSDKL